MQPLPLVLVHSLNGSPAQWAPQVAHFLPHRRVVAVALPGHAGREEADDYSFETLAADVAQQTKDLERFVLAGHSAGALVAICLADRQPDRVAGLLLVDPGTDGRAFPDEQAEPFLAALRSDAYAETAEGYWSHLLEGAPEDTRTQAMADLRATQRGAMPGVLDALRHFDAVTPLRRYAAHHPVMVVASPLSEGPLALDHGLAEVERVRVSDTSHWIQLDRPDVVNEAIGRLLDRLE